MTTTTTTDTGVRDLYYPTFSVRDVDRALRFYGALFGWTEKGERFRAGDTSHADLATAVPFGIHDRGEPGTTELTFAADDLDDALAAVVDAGGSYELDESGEHAVCLDDQGVRFGLMKTTHRPVSPIGRIPFDTVGYVTIDVPDGARGRRFYAAVLGWQYEGGLANPGFTTVPMGLAEGATEPGHTIFVKVADAAATAERVRALGGTAGTLDESPSGITVACTDDQGTRFALWQPAPGY